MSSSTDFRPALFVDRSPSNDGDNYLASVYSLSRLDNRSVPSIWLFERSLVLPKQLGLLGFCALLKGSTAGCLLAAVVLGGCLLPYLSVSFITALCLLTLVDVCPRWSARLVFTDEGKSDSFWPNYRRIILVIMAANAVFPNRTCCGFPFGLVSSLRPAMQAIRRRWQFKPRYYIGTIAESSVLIGVCNYTMLTIHTK